MQNDRDDESGEVSAERSIYDVLIIMQVLCAPDKFKGSLTASEAAESMAAGIRRFDPSIMIDLCPVADGGEGTIDIINRALTDRAVRSFTEEVAGPLGRDHSVNASWIMLKHEEYHTTAVIELASAAGLILLDESKRDALHTTTFGVGELIERAIDRGAQTIMVALGGSATCDGGCGLAQALGVRFTLLNGETLESTTRAITGREISLIKKIDQTDLQRKIGDHQIIALCDVENPLLGHEGAARIYAPQKGAGGEAVDWLERGLNHLARDILPDQDANAPGAGAAGGSAFGLQAWCRAELQKGFDTVMNMIHFDNRVRQADLIFTGEGRFDRQSMFGKAMVGVSKRAKHFKIPVMAIVGSVDQSFMNDEKKFVRDLFTDCQALTMLEGVHSREDAIFRARELLMDATEIVLRHFLY